MIEFIHFQTISYRNIFFVRNIFPVGFELSPYVWGNERESGRQTDRERERERRRGETDRTADNRANGRHGTAALESPAHNGQYHFTYIHTIGTVSRSTKYYFCFVFHKSKSSEEQ